MDKLYVVVRRDLQPGAQVAQAVHAALTFAHQYPQVCRDWQGSSNNLVVLSIPNEDDLVLLMHQLDRSDVAFAAFHEPDLDGELTALGIESKGRRLLSNLPLALRDPPQTPFTA